MMRIEQWDTADERAFLGCYAAHRAATKADEPVEPPMSASSFRAYLHFGFDNEPGEVWIAYDDADAVVAFYRLNLPDLENLDRASLDLVVHPAARRRGIGRELLRHGAGRADANSRTILEGFAVQDAAGDAFARAVGAKLVIEEIRRVQNLGKVAPGAIRALGARARQAAAGYSLVTWTGPIPEEYLADAAGVTNAYNDAPHPEGVEDAQWDADRMRERTGIMQRLGTMRGYGVAAIHDASGEMAGFTEVLIDPEQPAWAHQQLTAVIRTHRGHRLGLLLKTAMLEWLAEAEPQLEWIATGNAAENAHMIAVNEELGYEVVKPGWRFYEMPVADVHQPDARLRT